MLPELICKFVGFATVVQDNARFFCSSGERENEKKPNQHLDGTTHKQKIRQKVGQPNIYLRKRERKREVKREGEQGEEGMGVVKKTERLREEGKKRKIICSHRESGTSWIIFLSCICIHTSCAHSHTHTTTQNKIIEWESLRERLEVALYIFLFKTHESWASLRHGRLSHWWPAGKSL